MALIMKFGLIDWVGALSWPLVVAASDAVSTHEVEESGIQSLASICPELWIPFCPTEKTIAWIRGTLELNLTLILMT